MDDSPGKSPAQDHRALELTLHDGLDRLEEFALMLAFQGSGSQFEILSISPPSPCTANTETKARRPHTGNNNVICMRGALLRKTA